MSIARHNAPHFWVYLLNYNTNDRWKKPNCTTTAQLTCWPQVVIVSADQYMLMLYSREKLPISHFTNLKQRLLNTNFPIVGLFFVESWHVSIERHHLLPSPKLVHFLHIFGTVIVYIHHSEIFFKLAVLIIKNLKGRLLILENFEEGFSIGLTEQVGILGSKTL